MKNILILLVVLCTGCASGNNSAELDWREGEVNGTLASVPYTFEGDEITFYLFKHQTHEWRGKHELQIEDDEIKYKLKYVF